MTNLLQLDDLIDFIANDPEEAPVEELNFDDDQIWTEEDYES